MTSPSARRVLQHAADSRPAWLWSQDGQSLLWQNEASELFLAKVKKQSLKLAPLALPIKGQVARTIRLGSPERTSLARIQFLAGEKPVSSTCATTPLVLEDGQNVLLIVAVDAIDPEVLAMAQESQSEPPTEPEQSAKNPEPSLEEPLFASPTVSESEQAALQKEDTAGSASPSESAEASHEAPELPTGDAFEEVVEPPAEAASSAEMIEASPEASQLPTGDAFEEVAEAPAEAVSTSEMVEASPETPELPIDDAFEDVAEAPAEAASSSEVVEASPEAPELPTGDAFEEVAEAPAEAVSTSEMVEASPEASQVPTGDAFEEVAEAPAEAASSSEMVEASHVAEPPAEAAVSQDSSAEVRMDSVSNRLSRLVDRLSAGDTLYEPLAPSEEDTAPPTGDEQPVAPQMFRITGRGFTADAVSGENTSPTQELEPAEEDAPTAEPTGVDDSAEQDLEIDNPALQLLDGTELPPNAEAVERVSRYNFDELSRILTDRVGDAQNRKQAPAPAEVQRSGALVNLGGETLVLNRLPLGILVFRDQEVLFANRAITEMVGYDSVERLRAAGLAAIFPAMGPEGQEAGPVNHLVQRNGTLVPVTARLQSISWQGRPALMLSASTTEVRTSHEAAVRAFAQSFAELRGEGYFETTRAGVINIMTAKAAALLGKSDEPLEGKALSALLAKAETSALRDFLERPARFAETARPCLTLRSGDGRAEIVLFAQGQAGVVASYFGFVHGREAAPPRLQGHGEGDPGLLARVSRGVRRPLNTIVGFSDLLRSKAFGALDDERYQGYARDIATAGQEIAALVDELDDYARLRDGRYLPQRASIELTALLEGCVLRIRGQANSARVIVRNAISEHLPRITADRASLAQAVLNLLASAIDQSPSGGAVVISAQRTDGDGIAIHVRDSSNTPVDMAERFVVFREGVGKDGRMMSPVRSSVGLALTRSLLAVNAISLEVDPAGSQGLLFTLTIPADLVDRAAEPGAAE